MSYPIPELPQSEINVRLALAYLLNPGIAPLESFNDDVQRLVAQLASKLPTPNIDPETHALIEAHKRGAAENEKAKEIASYNRAKARAENMEHEGRRITFTNASTIKARPVRWLWEHRMPIGEITLLAGRAGLGKSTFGSGNGICRRSAGTLCVPCRMGSAARAPKERKARSLGTRPDR